MQAIIALIILVILAGFVIITYNNLVALFNRAQNAFAQIEVQLKRRYDLIPNLIEIAKKYMEHEKETLLGVTNARNSAKNALDSLESTANLNALNIAESNLNSALKGLNIQMEAYPELKANENMAQLSEELSSTENKIAFARQSYNDSVMNFNVAKQSFPANLIVGFFPKFKRDMAFLEFGESREVLESVPKVKF